MPNKMYMKGYRFENKIVNDLKEEGAFAVRTAGSHSPFDVIAIRDGELLLIQCKVTKEKLEKQSLPRILKVRQFQAYRNKRKTIMEEL